MLTRDTRSTLELPGRTMLDFLNPFTHKTWDPREQESPYTQLAQAARRECGDSLPAELLLPFDVVEIDGAVLEVRDVRRSRHLVALDFCGLPWSRCTLRSSKIHVLHKAEDAAAIVVWLL